MANGNNDVDADLDADESSDSSGLFGSDDSDACRLGNLLDLGVSRT